MFHLEKSANMLHKEYNRIPLRVFFTVVILVSARESVGQETNVLTNEGISTSVDTDSRPSLDMISCPEFSLQATEDMRAHCRPDSPTLCEACLAAVSEQIFPVLHEAYNNPSYTFDLLDEAQVMQCLFPLRAEFRRMKLPIRPFDLYQCPNFKTLWDTIEKVYGAAREQLQDNSTSHTTYRGGVQSQMTSARRATDIAFGIYSQPCFEIQERHDMTWSVNAVGPHNCIDGDTCSPTCLYNMKTFFDEFTAQKCEVEWLEGLRGSFTSEPQQVDNSEDYVKQMQRLYDTLTPALDASMNTLACNKNEAGKFCLEYTSNLQRMMSSSSGVSIDTKCEYFREMGCCAPLLVDVGFKAISALDASLGVELPTANVDDIIDQMNVQCAAYFEKGSIEPISVQVCDGMKSLEEEMNSNNKKWYKGVKPLAVALIAIAIAVVVGVVVGVWAYRRGQKEERKSGKINLELVEGPSSQ